MNISHSILLSNLPKAGESKEFTNAMTGEKRMMELVETKYQDVNFGELRDGTAVTQTMHLAVMKKQESDWKELWEIVQV